jgi:cellobiose phosphorylase
MFKVCREGKGESFWTSMFLGYSLLKMIELASLINEYEDIDFYSRIYEEQKERVNRIGWDGKWYRRAIMDNGMFLGTSQNSQAKLWLNTQSWAVISGFASGERGKIAMNSVMEYLDSDLGLKLIDPPITDFPDPDDPLTHYNKGTGENAAVFCHANTWAIIAETLLGRKDLAWKYYNQLIPQNASEKAGIMRYKAEPYVYSSNLFGPDSDKFGLANVSWLTGTATWMYIAVTQSLLGVRPAWDGLILDPVLPEVWEKINISRMFRGSLYQIEIIKLQENNSTQRGLMVNEKALEGNMIPVCRESKVSVKLFI